MLGRLPLLAAALLMMVSGAGTPAKAQSGRAAVEIVPSFLSGTSKPAISSDGKYVALAGGTGASLWDFKSKRLIRTFTGLDSNSTAVAISPDGARVATGAGSKLNIWRVDNGAVETSFDLGLSILNSIQFTRDGKALIYGGSPNSTGNTPAMYIREIGTGRIVKTFIGKGNADVVAVSDRGDYLAVGDGGGTIQLMTRDGRSVRSLSAHKNGTSYSPVTSLAFSPDGRYLASGGNDGTAKIWDISSGRMIAALPGHNGNEMNSVYSISWRPDGVSLATTDMKTLRIWDVQTGRLVTSRVYDDGLGPAFISVASYMPDGRTIVTDASGMCVADAETLNIVGKFGESNYAELVKGFNSGDDTVVLAQGGPQTFLKLNVLTGALSVLYRSPEQRHNWSNLATSRNGRRFAGLQDGSLYYVDIDRAAKPSVLRQSLKDSYTLDLSATGDRVAIGAKEGIFVHETETGRLIQAIKGGEYAPQALAFGPEGRVLVSDLTYETLSFVDVKSGQIQSRQKLEHLGRELATSADTKSFLVPDTGKFQYFGPGKSSRDFTIDLWSFNGPRLLKKFVLPGINIISERSVFDGSGARIATGGFEAIVRIWDITSAQVTHTLRGHTGPINSLQFAANGSRLVTAASDGLKIWDTNTSALLASFLLIDSNQWIVITPEGFFDASSPKAAQSLSIVQGLEVSSIDQVFNALYRPDLVREKLAGDTNGKVRLAAAQLDLEKVMASGVAPQVTITAPVAGTSAAVDEIEVSASILDRGGGIGRVEWRVNGVTLGIESRGLERLGAGSAGPTAGAASTMTRRLALERGDNRIEVVAYNEKNLIASERAQVAVRWDGEKTATPPRLHVLAVGVNDYYDSRLRLAYAVPDAAALAEAFRNAGAGLYDHVEVTKVLDADVTLANLDKVFGELATRVQPRDVFVFFLAGHGKTKNGRYYFLPRDFRYEDETSIEKLGLDQDKFQAWFAKVSARKSILLYDTCESGSLTGNVRGSDLDERLGALNRMARATGRTFLTATTDDAPAMEGYRGHGVFTYALLDALQNADVNKNGLIEVSELADYIDQKVPDFSFEAFKLRQIPQRSIVGNNFALTNRTEVPGLGAAGPAKSVSVESRPTHVVVSPADVYEQVAGKGTRVEQLAAGTLLSLVKTEQGWALVARDGKQIGYVMEDRLVRVQ